MTISGIDPAAFQPVPQNQVRQYEPPRTNVAVLILKTFTGKLQFLLKACSWNL